MSDFAESFWMTKRNSLEIPIYSIYPVLKNLKECSLVDQKSENLFSMHVNLIGTREQDYTIVKFPKYMTFRLVFSKPLSNKVDIENNL